jgi:uncharacterized protein YaiL (DUF2058 family)
MSNSLKDQLLGLGFKAPEPAPKPRPAERKPAAGGNAAPGAGKPQGARRPEDRRPADRRPENRRPQDRRPAAGQAPQRAAHKPAAPKAGFDLGKAYALRAQQEKDERIAAEAAKQEQARLRREARAKLVELLAGKALNDANAEHVRHFEYGGKIKRVHVTPEQLLALNKGELGVVQSEGRYVLVDAKILAQAKDVFAEAVALEVDPNAPAPADDYADPQFQIPDDLTW